jgi:DNA-binding NarL/FixJ family response regulator
MQRGSEVRVLVVHADPLISAGLVATLNEPGRFNVAVDTLESVSTRWDESSGSEAVLIADYDSALQMIGSSSPYRDKVIVVTGKGSESSISHALERGARGYFLLGCTVADLIRGIESVYDGAMAVGSSVASRIAERIAQRDLTKRECEILHQVMHGSSNKRVALALRVSEGTVKAHVKSILSKLGASNRTHAAAIARRRHIFSEEMLES